MTPAGVWSATTPVVALGCGSGATAFPQVRTSTLAEELGTKGLPSDFRSDGNRWLYLSANPDSGGCTWSRTVAVPAPGCCVLSFRAGARSAGTRHLLTTARAGSE